MNKQQTSVEWLFTMLNNPNRDQEFANKLLQKAKEMHEEEIMKAHISAGARLEDISIEAAKQYYEELYGGNK
jgi:hypothetical protein